MPADFDDAGHRGERPAGEDAGLHPRPAVERPGRRPLAAPYVKVKLDAIASEQYTPQMQLAHALKDARLALSPGRAAHHAGAGKHRRTVAAGGGRGICRRGFVCGISVAVAVVKSVVSYPRTERSGHGGHLSRRMGHQFESTVR